MLPGQCGSDEFLSTEAGAAGCLSCFCSGIPSPDGRPSPCRSAPLYRHALTAVPSQQEGEQFALVDSNRERAVAGQRLNINGSELQYDQGSSHIKV